jgi:hypothetical protein
LLALAWGCVAVLAGCAAGPSPSVPSNDSDAYAVRRIDARPTIDGRLAEKDWSKIPSLRFAEIVTGAPVPERTICKIAWDDDCLYIAGDLEDRDVWSRVGLRDDECDRAMVEAMTANLWWMPEAEWRRCETLIHQSDKFVKVFLDPDADGVNYVEFHINPLNNIFDAWYERGYSKPEGNERRGAHVSWRCEGLISATQVDGTLNAPHDADRGWSFEIAVPWKALAPLCKGACPPKPGDVWLAHVGRVDRPAFRKPRTYWTWPVVGVVQSHLPDTWGRLIFQGPGAVAMPAGDPLARERFRQFMGWGHGASEDVIPKAAAIGMTDFITPARGKNLEGAVKVGKVRLGTQPREVTPHAP